MEKEKIITKDQISKLSDGEFISGYVIIKECSIGTTKTNLPFASGILRASGSVSFKAWSNSTAYSTIVVGDVVGEIAYIQANVNIYNNEKSLILRSIDVYEGNELSNAMFFEDRYDVEDLWEKIDGLVKSNTTDGGYQVFKLMIDSVGEERFKNSFAAIVGHDAYVGGLAAHTMKMLAISRFLAAYRNIIDVCGRDVIVVGIALHDLGKALENNGDERSKFGNIVSHRLFNVELMSKNKDRIIGIMDGSGGKLSGEEFYYTLMSILTQHHGEYEEKPRTVAAFVVHLIDMFESQLQKIDQDLEDSLDDGEDLGMIKDFGYRLRYIK